MNPSAQVSVHTPAPVCITDTWAGSHILAHVLQTALASGTIYKKPQSDSLGLAGIGVGGSFIVHPGKLTETRASRRCFIHITFKVTGNEF